MDGSKLQFMKRKNFIAGTSILGLSVAAAPLAGCNNASEKEKPQPTAKKPTDDFELNETTIDALQQMMESGKMSAHQITELYLKRIENIDKNGPTLRAVIELNPNALKEADALDQERKNGKTRGPLHGIPILIKDNIDTADMSTTAGSLALEGFHPAQDAFIVKQLRAAGAVILGKTNLSEWANIRSEHSSSGWSSRGGQTKNPYMLDRSPVGSSSGSAAGVAANLCAVAVGSETDGSITAPSSANALVGLKPTVGLVSRAGIIPISQSQDTAGPIARTVKDAAILLGALTGVDDNDSATQNSKGKSFADYTPYLKKDALKGKRIGIEKDWKTGVLVLNELYKNALNKLREAGAELVEIELLKEVSKAEMAEFEVLMFELKDGMNRYLAKANASVKSLSDVIAFNLKNEDRVMPTFKQEIFDAAEKTDGLQSKKYLDAKAACKKAITYIDALFARHKLDAISGITMGPTCPIDTIYGDHFGETTFTSPAAIAGYPHISVPCGLVYRLPVGLSFFSTAYNEPLLLGIAYAYEQISPGRTKPLFLKNFDDEE